MAECPLLFLKDFITKNTTAPTSTCTYSPSNEVRETEKGETKETQKDSRNSIALPQLSSSPGHSYVGFGFGC